jgi:hypothetical protein
VAYRISNFGREKVLNTVTTVLVEAAQRNQVGYA